jgi:glycosyltransferase EpsE
MEISIIMGIYNCAPTLREAIDSLLLQTFQKFELIMCDDGSTDDTYKIAKEYADKYENITLLQNDKNKGLNFTLNKCLTIAKGKYIARMDGDDISLPTRFQKEYVFLESNAEYAIVSSAMIYFDENGDFKQNKPIEKPKPKDFVFGTPHCHAPCMVRKEAFDAVNGYTVDDKLLRVEDYHLWFKMYSLGYVGYNLMEPLYKMRDDRNATSRRTFRKRLNVWYVMHIGFKMLKLPFYYQIFSLRPILVGMLPKRLYSYLHRRQK